MQHAEGAKLVVIDEIGNETSFLQFLSKGLDAVLDIRVLLELLGELTQAVVELLYVIFEVEILTEAEGVFVNRSSLSSVAHLRNKVTNSNLTKHSRRGVVPLVCYLELYIQYLRGRAFLFDLELHWNVFDSHTVDHGGR